VTWRARPLTIVAQDHVAMQVETLGDGRPLIADQGGETARLVELVRGFGDVIPNVVIDSGSGRIIRNELLRNGQ
jgi:hypothetical protein